MTGEETLPSPFWVILTKENYAIRFSFDYGHTSALSFRVYEASCQMSPEEKWEIRGGEDGCGDYEDLAAWKRAFASIDGALKWDGCINWQTNPDLMVHGCGPSHVNALQAIFATVYHVGKRYNDLLGDPVPPMPEGAIELNAEGKAP